MPDLAQNVPLASAEKDRVATGYLGDVETSEPEQGPEAPGWVWAGG